jgi:hypothetical protein
MGLVKDGPSVMEREGDHRTSAFYHDRTQGSQERRDVIPRNIRPHGIRKNGLQRSLMFTAQNWPAARLFPVSRRSRRFPITSHDG